MNDIIFRRINKDDIKNLILIGSKEKNFEVVPKMTGFWQPKELERWIMSNTDSLFLAEFENEMIGFILISQHIPTGKATLENIWVRDDFRGKGISNKLLESGLIDIKKRGATYVCTFVKVDNLASENFFINRKFQKGYSFSWIHRGL